MSITYKQGQKHPKDVMPYINGHPITFRELAELTVQLIKNEDNIYPKPKYQGGDMLIDFLNECMEIREVKDETLEKYKL
jgi:hypothetical protein